MPRVRVRQHVNPLSQKYQQVIQPPDWDTVFAHPAQPLQVDIGCARGRFVEKMAQECPGWNIIGVEIREPLVIAANQGRDRLGLTNCHFLFGNINIQPQLFFQGLPANTLKRVTIQFPDPWFKQRHSKRRVAQPELISAIANSLPSGGEVFLQSDVAIVAMEMKQRFEENLLFESTHSTEWLAENPLPVPTEREIACFNLGRPVYRCCFSRR